MVRGHLTLLALAAGCATTANAAGSGRHGGHHRPLKPTAMEMPAKMTTHEIMMPEPGKREAPVRPTNGDNNQVALPPKM